MLAQLRKFKTENIYRALVLCISSALGRVVRARLNFAGYLLGEGKFKNPERRRIAPPTFAGCSFRDAISCPARFHAARVNFLSPFSSFALLI